MTDRVVIRPVREDERAEWEPLWVGYQTFYKTTIPAATTDITWQRFHDEAEPMYVLGAYVDGKLTGIVHYLFHRSAWTVGDYCYLQDLFVNADARGHGVGRKLIEAVYEKAKAAGASRVHWLTQFENARAQILYDEVADRSGFMQYRKIF
ncbi:GNAT superfamily N-acetyltransferase [Nitrobacteraceae bacterium AZCC 1564]